MDLSRAFNTIDHDILIAKLHRYGIEACSLKLLWNYLKNRWKSTKLNATYSSWAELLCGVPHGSILGSLLLNIHINDM